MATRSAAAGTAPSAGDAASRRSSTARGSLRKKKPTALPNFRVQLNTIYPIVRRVVGERQFEESELAEECNLLWYDGAPPLEAFARLQRFQRINHFPNTHYITHKDALARSLTRLQRAVADDGIALDFFPRSWILPAELQTLRRYLDTQRAKGRNATLIYKPTHGARGVGIGLTRQIEGRALFSYEVPRLIFHFPGQDVFLTIFTLPPPYSSHSPHPLQPFHSTSRS